jgi:hypothetical protein
MTKFLQIYFQNGDFTNEGSSVWIDLVITAVGAFLGLLGAIYVYRRQQKEERMDTLKYAAALLESIITYVKRQSKSCYDLAGKLAKITPSYDLYHKEASHDLKRLVERMDQDKLYHAFLAKYGRKEDIYRLFRNIFSQLDFADMTLSQLEDYLEKEQTLIAERKKDYLAYLDQGETKIALLTVNPAFQGNAPLMGYFNQFLIDYSPEKEDKTNEDLSYPVNAFVEPVIGHLTANYPMISACNDISLTLKKAANMFGLVKHKHEVLTASLKEFGASLKESAEKLSALTAKLRTDFAIRN